jgi:hypothetical protein
MWWREWRHLVRLLRHYPPDPAMIWTIIVILLVLWLLGLISGSMFGGFLHILLVIAIIVFIVDLLAGRRGV